MALYSVVAPGVECNFHLKVFVLSLQQISTKLHVLLNSVDNPHFLISFQSAENGRMQHYYKILCVQRHFNGM